MRTPLAREQLVHLPDGARFVSRWVSGENRHAGLFQVIEGRERRCLISAIGSLNANNGVMLDDWGGASNTFELVDDDTIAVAQMLAIHGLFERVQALFDHGWPVRGLAGNDWLCGRLEI